MAFQPILVVHYNELWLKGCNRHFFIRKLQEAVRVTLEDLPVSYSKHVDSRMLIRCEDETAARTAAERLQRTPGVEYIGLGFRTENRREDILDLGAELMKSHDFKTFRVTARRSLKTLPFDSSEIARELGARILAEAEASVKVDLSNPEVTCFVEATTEGAYVYREKIQGMGGLPTNTAGRLMCLLSGGIDSAVAAYKIMRRGVRVQFVHFYGEAARPGEDSPPIAREIVKKLTPYQGMSRLYLVPFDRIQREIVVSAPDEFRLLLYRRLMIRIGERAARMIRCHGLISGDSIAQVASQTLLNLEAVGAAATMPLYRPLCGDDKQEIVRISREIGCYEISNEPFTDCCPRYMPRNPRIFSSIEELDAAEAKLDVDAMVEQALREMVRENYEYRGGEVRLKSVRGPNAAAEEEAHAVALS